MHALSSIHVYTKGPHTTRLGCSRNNTEHASCFLNSSSNSNGISSCSRECQSSHVCSSYRQASSSSSSSNRDSSYGHLYSSFKRNTDAYRSSKSVPSGMPSSCSFKGDPLHRIGYRGKRGRERVCSSAGAAGGGGGPLADALADMAKQVCFRVYVGVYCVCMRVFQYKYVLGLHNRCHFHLISSQTAS